MVMKLLYVHCEAKLSLACDELIEYGPAKNPNEQGYSEEELTELSGAEKKNSSEPIIKKNKFGQEVLVKVDPTGRRIGEGKEYQKRRNAWTQLIL
jgi:hypothetical protein